jgi:hypothetical protein
MLLSTTVQSQELNLWAAKNRAHNFIRRAEKKVKNLYNEDWASSEIWSW